MPETLPFVTIDIWTMIFTWANLGILLLLMKKFLFKPILNIIKKREEEIKEMYVVAQKDKDESAEMKAEYTKKLAEAKQEANEIITNATRTAELRSEDIIKETQAQAANIIKKAEEDIKRDKKAAIEEIKSGISDMAVAIAGKVIEKDLSAKDHESLVAQCIDEMGESL